MKFGKNGKNLEMNKKNTGNRAYAPCRKSYSETKEYLN